MNTWINKPTRALEEFLQTEYQNLLGNGPFSEGNGFEKLGTYKEIIEEHSHCAGCGVALGIRLAMAARPSPKDSFIVGTPGCSFFSLSQAAVNYSNTAFGNQNAVASGLKRMLSIRHPGEAKDVVVLVGDGGIADIGLDMTLHSWFRGEKITTIMVDNELYGNTGGQESGMSPQGRIMNMAPTGKKFPKIPIYDMAKQSGCCYTAKVAVSNPKALADSVRKAIILAREIGPTYVQIYTPCPTNLKVPSHQTLKMAREAEKGYYGFEEFLSSEGEKFLDAMR